MMHHHKTLRVLSAGVAVAIAAGCFSMLPALAAPEAALAPGSSSYVAPTQEGLMENIHMLCGDTSVGPHSYGTPEEKHNAELYQQKFEEFNPDLETRVIEQPFASAYPGAVRTLHRITIDGVDRPVYGINRGKNNVAFPETAQIVNCGKGGDSDFPDGVSGKIALIERSTADEWSNATNEEVAAAQRAVDKGAAGLIFVCTTNGAYSNGNEQMKNLTNSLPDGFPAMVLQKSYGATLKEHLNKDLSFGTVNCDKTWTTEAVLKPKSGESDGILLVTAHYDSIIGGSGANDNGSGAAMLMEMAKLYSNVDSNLEIRFVAFGAEEPGLIGSNLYVNSLTDEEKDNILCVLNTDEVATPNPDWNYLSAEVVDGHMNLSASLLTGAMGDLMDTLPQDTDYRIYKFGGTDHVPFDEKGIDACGFFRGNQREDSEPGNHTELDTVKDNISPERLFAAGNILSKAISRVIDAHPSTELELTTSANEDGSTHVVVENTEQVTGLSHSLTVEATGDSAKTQTITLEESDSDYAFDLPADGTYSLKAYSTGTGVTNWGNAHGEKYAEEDYTIDLGTYEVYSGSSITNLDTTGPDYTGNMLMTMSKNGDGGMLSTGTTATNDFGSENAAHFNSDGIRCGGASPQTEELLADDNLPKLLHKAKAATEPANYQVGDKKTMELWVGKNEEGTEETKNIEFEVVYAGKSIVLWRDTAHPEDLTDENANIMGKQFDDSNAYAELEAVYGDFSFDVDQDNKVSFLFYRDSYADGFFDFGHMFSKEDGGHGNMIDALNICGGTERDGLSNYNDANTRNYQMGVAVHEFQHMITRSMTYGIGKPSDGWMDEMVSQEAVKLVDYNPSVLKSDVSWVDYSIKQNGCTPGFLGYYNNYGSWYLFARYLVQQTKDLPGGGDNLFATMFKNGGNTKSLLIKTLEDIGYIGEGKAAANFEELVRNFNLALYAQETKGLYSFNSEDVYLSTESIKILDAPLSKIPSGGGACFSKIPRDTVVTTSGADSNVLFVGFNDTSIYEPPVADSGLIANQPNLAADATPTASYTNSYSAGVKSLNDGKYDEGNSKGTTYGNWNSWGQGQWTQNVTYTWDSPVTINATDVMFWYDGGGVDRPTKYRLDYLDQNGAWQQVSNGAGYTLNADTFNLTTFDTVTTTKLKLTLYRDWSDYEGVGIYEWRVYEAASLSELAVKATPDKTEYQLGEKLDLNGLVLQAVYSNGYKKTVMDDYTVSDVDMNTAGTKTVTVTYKGTSVDLPIEVKGPNKTNLNDFIAKAQGFVDDGTVDGMVESAKKVYLDTLAKAKEVAANKGATYAEVMDVQTKLMVCITAVSLQAGDKEALGSLIDSCTYFTDETLAANYVEAGQAEYKAALAAANKVYADGDAFQEDVDKARDDLFNAVSALRMKANKSALQALLNQVNGIDLSLYSEESVALLHTAMENVNSVLANEALSVDDQATVDKAVKTLQAAVDGLQLKQTAETPETPADPTDPNKSTDPSDNSASSESSKAGTTSKTSAKTGDAVPMAGAAVLVLAAGAAAILIKRHKK